MTPLRAINWALLLGIVAFALATYAGLPAEIPTGIDAGGSARGWREKSLPLWLLVPGLALVLHLSFELLRYHLPRKPEMFNFSEKERLLKLPREYQAPVIVVMQQTMDVIALTVLVTVGYIQFLLWQTAHGRTVGVSTMILLVGGVMMTPLILIVASRVTTATEEAEKRWKAADRSAA